MNKMLKAARYSSGLFSFLLAGLISKVALAAGGVQYGTPPAGMTKIDQGLSNIAAGLFHVLGYTGLIALLIGALMLHFGHSPRAQDTGKEVIRGAIIGILVAVFAPIIVNTLFGLNVNGFF